MTDSERIRAIEKMKNLSTNALAKQLELKTAQTLYDIHKGKHGISKDLAEIISSKYLDINKLWLLTGEGEMLITQDVIPKHPPKIESDEVVDARQMMQMMQDVLEANKQLVECNKQLMESNRQLTEQVLKMANGRGSEAEAEERRPHQASDQP